MIVIPPKSWRLQRIVMESMVTIITRLCSKIIGSSLLTWPSLWALSLRTLPLYHHDWVVYLDMV